MSAFREELSPDELRKRLYQTFKSKGTLATLQAQLKNQLIVELKRSPPPPAAAEREPGLVSACNSIVDDYLQKSGYEYSRSVFQPECRLSQDETLSKRDILRVVKIAPESSLYEALSAQENCDKSFLMSLLMQLRHRSLHGRGNNAVTQISMSSFGDSLQEKMQRIDREYDNRRGRADRFLTPPSKLEWYKKEMEERLQADMKRKLQRFKDVELAHMQMEEKAKFSEELVRVKRELEETYEEKTRLLMEQEENVIARLHKRQEIEVQKLCMQRQEVLKEIEAVRSKESELSSKVEAFETNRRIHEEKVKATVELLRKREAAVKTAEDAHDQRLRRDLCRYRRELDEEFIKRTEECAEIETRNRKQASRLSKESAELDAKREEHARVCSEIKRMGIDINAAQQRQCVLNEQKEFLKEKLETMSDYAGLKSEREELQSQVRLLDKQLKEALKEKKHLHAVVQRMRSAQRRVEEDSDKQRRALQAQLQGEVEYSGQLRARLTECEEKARWTSNRAEDVEMQLRQTQRALETEVLRLHKPSPADRADRSVLEVCGDDPVPPDICGDGSEPKARAPSDSSRADGASHGGHTGGRTPDSDRDIIADAKARMMELQREAETVEEAYRNYQQRAVVSNVSHPL
ncbi:centriole and centriolar satellite protein ofd1-like [Eucyclogobius newberryi]|uniref:centriole and centriolar satellite protein ofd1-like n=1 Tax=Eucyclogobius newberryi TaxID=166745 RepID=UPI003B5B69A9